MYNLLLRLSDYATDSTDFDTRIAFLVEIFADDESNPDEFIKALHNEMGSIFEF